jgi:methylenetetrahydrofolate dehydrogenase (NADP+) / methenyltetrahydrofolate cyclohydrolase
VSPVKPDAVAAGTARPTPLLLDGVRLADERLPALARRAAAVLERRGRPASLLLVAAETRPGHAPHVERKRRACARAGIAIRTVLLPAGSTTRDLRAALQQGAEDDAIDGIFLQFPLAAGMDGDAAAAVIPAGKDIDLANPAMFERFVDDAAVAPPLTPGALLELLDHYGIEPGQSHAVIVAEPGPLARAFRVVLDRRGAHGPAPLAPGDPDLDAHLRHADMVVVATARPGTIRSDRIPAGATAIDAGYFNPGGRGDIDTTGGTAHLEAFAPVPGGIGPMTVSVLLEAVISRAERL